jgi:hypothetical protein
MSELARELAEFPFAGQDTTISFFDPDAAQRLRAQSSKIGTPIS